MGTNLPLNRLLLTPLRPPPRLPMVLLVPPRPTPPVNSPVPLTPIRLLTQLLRPPRPPPMPSSLPTMPELHGRRISSREVRTRTDPRKSTRTPPPRPLRSTESMTREREPTADFSRPSLPSEQHTIDRY